MIQTITQLCKTCIAGCAIALCSLGLQAQNAELVKLSVPQPVLQELRADDTPVTSTKAWAQEINKDWTPNVIESTDDTPLHEYITLTLSPDHPQTVKLKVVADGDWSIEGVKESASSTNRKTDYTPIGQTIKLIGDIRELDCASAHISALDLTASSKLLKLDCSINDISTLDLSTHEGLVRLDCNSNNLTTLSVANNKL